MRSGGQQIATLTITCHSEAIENGMSERFETDVTTRFGAACADRGYMACSTLAIGAQLLLMGTDADVTVAGFVPPWPLPDGGTFQSAAKGGVT